MSSQAPETRFASCQGRNVAYQVLGSGPLDLVFAPGSFNNVDVWWEHPITASFFRSLASFSRLIILDRRGTGASDPLPSDELPDWRDWKADLLAVLDAAESTSAAIYAAYDGVAPALWLAHEHPERVRQLVFFGATARFRHAPDYPIGLSEAQSEAFIQTLTMRWGTTQFSEQNYADRLQDSDFLRWYAKYQRACLGPGRIEPIMRAWFDIDARHLLAKVRAPTLVIQREGAGLTPLEHGRWLAESLPLGVFAPLPGSSGMFGRDSSSILDLIARFLTGKEVGPDGEHGRSRADVPGYTLRRRIGRGGMAEVWEAASTADGTPVAIKLVRAGASADLRARLAREADATRAVRHPAIVEIRELTETAEGTPAIVMDLLEGETLGSKLSREGPLSVATAAALMLPVVSAVGAAHALGIVHRDLKPGNIFLQRAPEGELRVKVLDFGIARLSESATDVTRLTTTAAILGTPAYMAPEQLFGEQVDHRADIWALGLILFELLAGMLPTRADNMGHVLKIVLTQERWAPKQVVNGVPGPLSELVARMLSRERADRPNDLREVFELLATLATPDAVPAAYVGVAPPPLSGGISDPRS